MEIVDNIVFSLKKLNFEQNTTNNKVLTENCTKNFHTLTTTANQNLPWRLWPTTTTTVDSIMATTDLMPTTSVDNDYNDEEENADDDFDDYTSTSIGGMGRKRRGGVCMRRMPARASKDAFNALYATTIGKPKKRSSKEFKMASRLSEFKKIYANQKLTKFHPSNLETIFEEDCEDQQADAAAVNSPTDDAAADITSQVRIVQFGNRKLRRAISFNDGLTTNKALVKRRRAKIKKSFGRRFAWKKIPMNEFHDRLNKSLEEGLSEEKCAENSDNSIAPLETPPAPPVTPTICCSSAAFGDAEMNLLQKATNVFNSGQCNGA